MNHYISTKRWGVKWPLWLAASLLVLIISCGGDATATPQPAALPIDTAALTALVQEAIEEAATGAEPAVSEQDLARLVEEAVTGAVASGASAAEIQALVEAAVAAAVAPGVTSEEIEALVSRAVPTAVVAPTAVPPAVSAKVTRLRVAFAPPTAETNRIWAGDWNILLQQDPYADTLMGNDPKTAASVPELAESWEVTNGFKTWTFKLREGIPFHDNWGEFTSADVVHTYELVTRDDSLATVKATWDSATLEPNSDHEISFHFDPGFIDGGRIFSRLSGDLVIHSKAQWDAQGVEGYDDKPVGTGGYEYLDRSLGEFVRYQRVPDHWSESPDFEEFEWVWAPESVTRLTLLLTEAVHASEITRDLQPQVERADMRVIAAGGQSSMVFGVFGGLYLSTGNQYYQPPGPVWEDPLVREALNKAVDRDVILEEIYLGQAVPVIAAGLTPISEGWNPEWAERFDAEYAYDPDAARELLEQAGYGPDNPLKFDSMTTLLPGNPELPLIHEALQIMFADIGVEMTIQELDVGTWIDRFLNHDVHNTFWATRNAPIRAPQEFIRTFHASEEYGGVAFHAEYDFLNEQYDILRNSVDPTVRAEAIRNVGSFIFDNYLTIPLFSLPNTMTVNPEIIADWPFPGVTAAQPSHVHLIKSAQ